MLGQSSFDGDSAFWYFVTKVVQNRFSFFPLTSQFIGNIINVQTNMSSEQMLQFDFYLHYSY